MIDMIGYSNVIVAQSQLKKFLEIIVAGNCKQKPFPRTSERLGKEGVKIFNVFENLKEKNRVKSALQLIQ